MSYEPCDLLVVGGGAAGLFCACVAAERGLAVTVLERNDRPGRKLLITGKGRCNITNECGRDEFLTNVRANPRFLYSALSRFAPADTIRFFESRGLALKTERGRRVFPQSDRAADVADCLVESCRRAGVVFARGRAASLLLDGEGAATRAVGVVTEDGRKLYADAIVLATGGLSYPATGSTGDGYRLAEQAGHTVTPTRPSLVPVECAERTLCASLMGLSLRNVTLSLTCGGKLLFSELGELLFTHFGLSGPLVLSASAYMKEPAKCRFAIDLKPGLDEEQLDARLVRDFAQNVNRVYRNALDALLPARLIPVVVERSGVDPDKRVNQLTRADRAALIGVLKAFTLTPARLRPIDEAVITSGGVCVGEIDPKTMASKRCRSLYIVGELLDVDAYTGGYNLQIAFSTAFVAAEAAADSIQG